MKWLIFSLLLVATTSSSFACEPLTWASGKISWRGADNPSKSPSGLLVGEELAAPAPSAGIGEECLALQGAEKAGVVVLKYQTARSGTSVLTQERKFLVYRLQADKKHKLQEAILFQRYEQVGGKDVDTFWRDTSVAVKPTEVRIKIATADGAEKKEYRYGKK